MTVMLTFLGVSVLSFVGLIGYLVHETKNQTNREVNNE